MTYIIIFIISCILIELSERTTKHIAIGKIRIRVTSILAFFSIILLSTIAGLRDNSIGTDVNTYVVYAFQRAKSYHGVLNVFQNHYLELGYELLVYLCALISEDIHFLHFATAFIIYSCVYKFLKYFLNRSSVTFGLFIFLMMYYNTTFNYTRQWLGIAIILVGIKYMIENKTIFYYLYVGFAALFHPSCLIAITFPFLLKLLRKHKDSFFRIMLIIIGLSICIISFDKIVNIFINAGILPIKYNNYFQGVGNSSVIMQLFARLPVLLLGLMFYQKVCRNDDDIQFLFCFIVIDAILGCCAPLIGDASRISIFFGIFQCVYVPKLIISIKKTYGRSVQRIMLLMLIIYYSAYWIYSIVIRNFGQTYPYLSDVLLNLF